MTTVALFMRCILKFFPEECGHGAKAIDQGGEEAVVRRADAAKGQGPRQDGDGRAGARQTV